MSPRVVNGLSRAMFDSDLVATRLVLAVAEFSWAIMLFWPGDTFGRLAYAAMGLVAPELFWAVVFLLSAFVQGRIVVLQCFHTRGAEIFATFNALLWCSTVGLMLVNVHPPPAAIGGEIALMVSACWIAVRPILLARGAHYAASTY